MESATAGAGASRSGREAGDGRGPWRRLSTWALLEADRVTLSAALLVLLFAAFVAMGVLDPAGIASAVASGDPVGTTFQAYIAAIVTGVTLVVTINQLVLSQELGAVSDQRERMAGALEFRDDVEATLGQSPSPADPAAFLRALVEETRRRVEAAAAAADDLPDRDRRERVDRYADRLSGQAATVADRLDGARFGTFDVLSAALALDYAGQLHGARRLRRPLDGGDVAEALDGVVETLELFGATREHVKTLYFQWALIDLSRAVLYAAVPALAVATGMTLYAGDPGSIPGATLGVPNVLWAVSAASAVSLLPFVLLAAYILRIATVAKRTLAIGPFVLREADGDGG